MDTENIGYVYALSNASYSKALLKIGYTRKSPEQRATELFSGKSGVPENFQVEYACSVFDCVEAEHDIHKILDSYRHNKNREFFYIPVHTAKSLISKVCKIINEKYNFQEIDIIDNTENTKTPVEDETSFEKNGVIFVDPKNIILPEKPQSKINSSQALRVEVMYDTIKPAIKDSFEELVYSFEMDTDPEREIGVCEKITKEYIVMTTIISFTDKQLPELMRILKLLTIYNRKQIKSFYKRKSITSKQLDTIFINTKLNIIPLKGHRRT